MRPNNRVNYALLRGAEPRYRSAGYAGRYVLNNHLRNI